MTHAMTKVLVERVLRHPENSVWTVQGFSMLRTYFGKDGQQWVDAEPREATKDEISAVTGRSLKRWFA